MTAAVNFKRREFRAGLGKKTRPSYLKSNVCFTSANEKLLRPILARKRTSKWCGQDQLTDQRMPELAINSTGTRNVGQFLSQIHGNWCQGSSRHNVSN